MKRRGKAPPVDPFTAEDMEVSFDDWIPALAGMTHDVIFLFFSIV